MLKYVFAALLAGTAMPAAAADLPVRKAPPPAPVFFNWTGFYIGAHVGYGWGDKDISVKDLDAPNSALGPICTLDPAFDILCLRTGDLRNPLVSHSFSGPLGGAQAGFNFQTGPIVFGVEGQFSWTGIDDDQKKHLAEFRFLCGFIDECVGRDRFDLGATSEVNWLATITGRVGFAVDRILLYAKGGVAFIDQDHHWSLACRAEGALTTICGAGLQRGNIAKIATASWSDTRTGFVIGGGLEYAFAGNWSAKVEYNFMEFGDESTTVTVSCKVAGVCGPTGLAPLDKIKVDVDNQMHVVKFGINYRFWGDTGVSARY